MGNPGRVLGSWARVQCTPVASRSLLGATRVNQTGPLSQHIDSFHCLLAGWGSIIGRHCVGAKDYE